MVSFSQVIIIFPDQQQKSDIVQLRGPKNEVEKCAKFLQKLIAELVQELFPLASFLLSDNICFVTNTRSKKEQILCAQTAMKWSNSAYRWQILAILL